MNHDGTDTDKFQAGEGGGRDYLTRHNHQPLALMALLNVFCHYNIVNIMHIMANLPQYLALFLRRPWLAVLSAIPRV